MKPVPRLLDSFIPEHYALSLDLSSAKDRTFSGTVTINGTLVPQANQISLHAKNLTISSVLVDGKSAAFSYTQPDTLSITHVGLSHGDHIVTIAYSGTITDAMHGLYPCYFEHEGVKKELLATQFESHHAREVLPCVDEPSAKATYSLTLTTVQHQTVLANMPIEYQHTERGILVTKFEKSPRMSSYLLAFVVGELHKVSSRTKNDVEVNIWATPAQKPETLTFALDIATRTIDFFEDYFGVPYPLTKCDNVALPDFSSGAMENWGIITYRESCLLADPQLTPISSRRLTATVIAHELSHQWFGNLVTMKWWNDLWLNESFASLMEYIAVDALEPEWNVFELFASYEVTSALRRDSLDGVQPVQTDVHHPDEISTLFDPAIVYAKGSRLVNMARLLVGEEDFRKGLKAYFETFAYRNTEGDDLWLKLEESSGKPIRSLMSEWISQPGLPLVSVEVGSEQTKLTQTRFFIGEHSPSTQCWPIPLLSKSPILDEILDRPEATYPAIESPLINSGLGSHFVTRYDDASFDKLFDQAARGELTVIDKIGLLQDAPLLSRAGLQSSAKLAPLSLAFCHETNERLLSMAAGTLSELRKFVERSNQAHGDLKKLSVKFAKPTYDRLGWEEKLDEPDDERENRATALSMMVYGEDSSALKTAKEYFENTDIASLPTELRSLIISAVVKHYETPDMVAKLLKLYGSTPSTDLQLDIAIGLSATTSQATAATILQTITAATIIRPQDASRWFAYMIRAKDARPLAWQWLKDNWAWIEKTYSGDKSYDDFIRYAASSLLTRDELNDFIAYFTPKLTVPALTRTIQLGIKDISARVELLERDSAAVYATLQNLA